MDQDALDIPGIRKRHGLTQQGLADLAGVNLSTVWRWENGNPPRGPAKAFLARLRDETPQSREEAA
jgi:transcriptional regulator with XRE-family HTH domain